MSASSIRAEGEGLGTSTAVGFSVGFAVGRERLRRRRVALAALLGAALVAAGALVERRAGALFAVDRALLGTFRLVIPLVSFGIATEAAGRGTLSEGALPVARFGAPGRAVALGLVASGTLAASVLGALFATGSVALARAPGAPPFFGDAITSAWIGALTAAAYVAWFSLGSTFLRHGRGRFIPLVVDFLFGGSAGVIGAALPRGNALNLLGGAAPLHLPQAASSALLVGMALVLPLLAVFRCRR
jgi:hypothetical protein